MGTIQSDSSTDDITLENLSRLLASERFFQKSLANEEGFASGADISKYLRFECGFLPDDPRFKLLFRLLYDKYDDMQYRTDITLEEFLEILSMSNQSIILERAFRSDLAIPDFRTFCKDLQEILLQVQENVPETQGKLASYIPQLSKVDPKRFGLSICTIDGQRFHVGDSKVNFCIQSCIKPILYCLALEEHGEDNVHKHIGREPRYQ